MAGSKYGRPVWMGDEEKQVLGKTEAMNKRKKKTKHTEPYMKLACIIFTAYLFSSFKNAYQDFSKMKQSNNESNLREEVLKNLAVANDNFVELVANLKEGTKVW